MVRTGKRVDPYYLSPEWRSLRGSALRRDGGRCVVPGCGKAAVVVDHIVSRRAGGPDTLANLRSLCRDHDQQVKEAADGRRRNGGRLTVRGCDADGWPRDPAHSWNQGQARAP